MKKISANIKRKLSRAECININKFCKKFSVEVVYDAVNELALTPEKDPWYYQLRDMCEHLSEFADEEKKGVKDLLNAKKFKTRSVEHNKDTM